MKPNKRQGCGMMKSKIIRIAALVLACALASAFPITAFAEQTPISVPKEEVVYANLLADGQVAQIYVVNAFDLAAPATVLDYGSYDSIVNLTTTDSISAQNGEVRMNAPAGRFYYQGNTGTASLPWDVAIEYLLDGKPVKTTELAGASGRLVIAIHVRTNPGVDPVFADNYMLQVAITLDTERCTNIEAQGAMIANAGKNKIITFTKMPGNDADYAFAADVTDFEMDGIQISGVPFSLEFQMPSTGELTEQIGELQDGIVKIDDGARSLNSGVGELDSGMGEFDDGMQDMQNGMQEFKDGFNELIEGNSKLKNGSVDIYNALLKVESGMSQFSAATQDMTQLTQGSAAIAQGIKQISDGMGALNGSFASADSGIQSATGYTGLHDANVQTIASLSSLASDPANAAIASQLQLAIAVLTADDQLIGGLRSGLDGSGGLVAGAQALDAQYAQFDAGIQALPAAMSQMGSGLFQLRAGISQLAANYLTFHNGLAKYVDGTAALFSGYQTLCEGFDKLVDGSGELASGVSELHSGTKQFTEGTGELKSKTSTMDTDIEDKIDELMDEYKPDDFSQVSFASARNTTIQSVQFVMQSARIEKPEQTLALPTESKSTFWQRVLALFQPKA